MFATCIVISELEVFVKNCKLLPPICSQFHLVNEFEKIALKWNKKEV